MFKTNRRDFLRLAGLSAATAAAGLGGLSTLAQAKSGGARVVVIGGGYGGSTFAKYMTMYAPAVKITMIEPKKEYISCPFSNEVIAGDASLDDVTFNYAAAKGRGTEVVHDYAEDIDPVKKRVTTRGGKKFDYDYLVISPGIQMRWGAIEGYDEAASEVMPHAWQAGPQTVDLHKRLKAMPDNGLAVISVPANPFRCPPGPYERAAQFALYLKHHKPKAKVLILDAKDAFAKQKLFLDGYKHVYGDMIEWRPAASDGTVRAVNAKTGKVKTDFEELKPDVVNIIPPHKAGEIAFRAGLTNDAGWCPVNQATFESDIHKDVFVIGDSCVAGAMPKSGYSASSQAKVCAVGLASRLAGLEPAEPSYINTCYSLISHDYAISVAAVYALQDGKIAAVKGAAGVSPLDAPLSQRLEDAHYARSWFRNITADTFG